MAWGVVAKGDRVLIGGWIMRLRGAIGAFLRIFGPGCRIV